MINNLKKIQTKLNKIRLKKKIVLCHGVFDLVHLGHIKHFKSAKKFGDFLIVSITTNKFINKGPGRPIFDQNQRLEYLKELKIIDEVIISNKESAEDVIKIVKPDFYVKGPDYKINSKDKTQNIKKEKTVSRAVIYIRSPFGILLMFQNLVLMGVANPAPLQNMLYPQCKICTPP